MRIIIFRAHPSSVSKVSRGIYTGVSRCIKLRSPALVYENKPRIELIYQLFPPPKLLECGIGRAKEFRYR